MVTINEQFLKRVMIQLDDAIPFLMGAMLTARGRNELEHEANIRALMDRINKSRYEFRKGTHLLED